MPQPPQSRDSIPAERIANNLARVRSHIGEAAQKAGRDPNSVTLVAVTKYASIEETSALKQLGVRDFGESRVQDAEKKIAAVAASGLRWHLIGHLQTNKAKQAVKLFQVIHSIDSARVAQALDTEARKAALTIHGLIEINAASEANKFGLPPELPALIELLKICGDLPALRIAGLMSMAPHSENPESTSRPVFKKMRELLEAANAAHVYPHTLTELSMGMTQDYAIAIEEGATLVRVGSALFE